MLYRMTPLVVLLAAAAGLLALAVVTARPVAGGVADLDGYLTGWQALHGDYDPRRTRFLRGWLMLAFFAARPLARRGVQPDVVTLGSVWLAGAVLVAAAAEGRWFILAGSVLVASGLSDTLDGAVATLTDRATALGYVVDSVVDRVNDALYLVAVWIAGAPVWLAVSTGAACWLLEYLRARAAALGAGQVGMVTVGERANRVIFCAAALVSAGLLPGRAALLATVWTSGLAVLTAVGFAQLSAAVRRHLT